MVDGGRGQAAVAQAEATAEAERLGAAGFAASPALARGQDGALWLAYLDFDGEAERVRLVRRGSPSAAWSAPLDLSERGVLFPPTIAATADGCWVSWVARDPNDVPGAVPGDVPAERATFSLWARHASPTGVLTDPVRLDGGRAGERPYHPALASGRNGTAWLVYEVWRTGPTGPNSPSAPEQPVTLHLRRCPSGSWGEAQDVPVPAAWREAGRPARAYEPTLAVDTAGAVHVAWWSPNDGIPCEPAGTREGTTADDLRRLDESARAGHEDGGATGSDVWYTRLDPGAAEIAEIAETAKAANAAGGPRWSEPERLNVTDGWHLNPSLTADDAGRIWAAWSAVTGLEIYGNLNSDVPYVQTGRARARRAMWFRESRPVVRVRPASIAGWRTVAGAAAAPVAEEVWATGREPGAVWQAGHALLPSVACAGNGAVALVVRRYGPNQKAEIDTGEQRVRLRAFETALLWLTDHGWSAPEVLHTSPQGGILGAASATGTSDGVVAAWQADLGTRNRVSDVCLAARTAPPATPAFEPLPASAPRAAGDRQRAPQPQTRAGAPYFGNIHMHTEQSFCRRPTSMLLDFNYRWAQDCMRQDFAVLTDHAETKSAYEWWLNRKTAAFYTTPAFVALLGYEWTTRYDAATGEGHGHLDVYFRGDPPRFWPANAVESSTTTGLWELLAKGEQAGYPAFTAAHHPSVHNFRRSWARWGQEAHEPVVEIHQDRRGSFERPGAVGSGVLSADQHAEGHTVRDALARGYRMGFVSGGDHMGISMTAVYAPALTREAIFDAMRARRCYAVTGARTLLHVEVALGGATAEMGQSIRLGAAAPAGATGPDEAAGGNGAHATVRTRVHAPSPLRRVVLVVDGEDVAELPAGGAAEATLDQRVTLRPGSYCYVRAELQDGEIAWSSPTFVDE